MSGATGSWDAATVGQESSTVTGTDWVSAAEQLVAEPVKQVLAALACPTPAELVRTLTGHPEHLVAAARVIHDEIGHLELVQGRLHDEMFLLTAWQGHAKDSLVTFMTEAQTALTELRQSLQELHDGLLTNARALEDAARFIIAGAIALTSAALAAVALMVSYPMAGLALLRFVAVRWYSIGDTAAKIASAGFLSYLVWENSTARSTAFADLRLDRGALGRLPEQLHTMAAAGWTPSPGRSPSGQDSPGRTSHHDLSTWHEARNDARAVFPGFDQLSGAQQQVLTQLAHETGRTRLREFTRLRSALAQGDLTAAARELLDSRWARSAGPRAAQGAAVLAGG